MWLTQPSISFAITKTWSGELIGDDEQVACSLTWLPTLGVLRWVVEAPFHGDPAPEGPPGHRDVLWEHEVVELFLVGPASDTGRPYLELELSPHGHFLVLALRDIRALSHHHKALSYSASIVGSRWQGQADIPVSWVPEGTLSWNAYAIHGEGERRRYLAMTPVPGDAPDFHRLHCFEAAPFGRT